MIVVSTYDLRREPRVDWIWMTVAVAVITWIVEKTLDAMLERWRRRCTTPMTDAQVRRHHHVQFALAVAMLLYVLALLAMVLAGAMHDGYGAPAVLLIAALGALAVFLWRVMRRRWRRL